MRRRWGIRISGKGVYRRSYNFGVSMKSIQHGNSPVRNAMNGFFLIHRAESDVALEAMR